MPSEELPEDLQGLVEGDAVETGEDFVQDSKTLGDPSADTKDQSSCNDDQVVVEKWGNWINDSINHRQAATRSREHIPIETDYKEDKARIVWYSYSNHALSPNPTPSLNVNNAPLPRPTSSSTNNPIPTNHPRRRNHQPPPLTQLRRAEPQSRNSTLR